MAAPIRTTPPDTRAEVLDRLRREFRLRRADALLEGWARSSENRAVAGMVLERVARRRAAADRARIAPPPAD
jgi:hypothetical protein